MTEKLELTILRNLLCSEEYFRKVVPFLKKEYFQEPVEQNIFEEISDFASTYDKFPTKEVLIINLAYAVLFSAGQEDLIIIIQYTDKYDFTCKRP